MALHDKIIDDVAEIPTFTNIAYSALGEPLLDPYLVDRITYAHNMCPDKMLETYTNGTLLSPSYFNALRGTGLDRLYISLNAVNAAQHERITGMVNKYDRVVANTEYAISNCGPVKVFVTMVYSKDLFTETDLKTFHDRWGRHAYAVWELNWAGASRTTRPFDQDSTCDRALGQLSVLWDGTVTQCCFDPFGKNPMGELRTQSIREVYNSEPYVRFRQSHDEGRASEYPLCRTCSRV